MQDAAGNQLIYCAAGARKREARKQQDNDIFPEKEGKPEAVAHESKQFGK